MGRGKGERPEDELDAERHAREDHARGADMLLSAAFASLASQGVAMVETEAAVHHEMVTYGGDVRIHH